MPKVIATSRIDSVYVGWEQENNHAECSLCKTNQGCQYTAENEYYKLGYSPIEIGEIFEIEYDGKSHVRLKCKDDLLHDVSIQEFENCFIEYNP